MFDTSMGELVLVFVIGLLILGPERLPRVAAQIGRWVAKARRTANHLRYQIEREIALEEFQRQQKRREAERASKPAETQAADSGGSEAQGEAGTPPEAEAGAAAPEAGAA